MYIVVTLEIEEEPKEIKDLAKATSWQIHQRCESRPVVAVNQPLRFESGYGDSSVPMRIT